jgi:hypothetical protein
MLSEKAVSDSPFVRIFPYLLRMILTGCPGLSFLCPDWVAVLCRFCASVGLFCPSLSGCLYG